MKSSTFIDSTTRNTYTLRTLFRLTYVTILGEIDNIQKKKILVYSSTIHFKVMNIAKIHFSTFDWLWNTSISFCSGFLNKLLTEIFIHL